MADHVIVTIIVGLITVTIVTLVRILVTFLGYPIRFFLVFVLLVQ